jgi:phosphopantothenoylcysteine decarboxylase/phosphopantothenate--cysteine ligase
MRQLLTIRPLRLLISAGPTREPIDPVRFISNYSTGYMGSQLAAEALARGHRVTVVSGPITEPLPSAARVVTVREAREMEAAMRRMAPRADAVIMAAAVSDFRPARARASKLRRRTRLTLRLEATPDILTRLPRHGHQLRVGFALEGGRVVPAAMRKLRAKRLDLLLAQRLNGRDAPFGRGRVEAWLLARGARAGGRHPRAGQTAQRLGRVSKSKVARVLLDKIEELWYGQRRPTTS